MAKMPLKGVLLKSNPLSCLLGSILFSPQEITKMKVSKIVMVIHLRKKCPGCGHDDLLRIYRKWNMRLIPFTKRYCCNVCRTKFMVNSWAAVVLMPIT